VTITIYDLYDLEEDFGNEIDELKSLIKGLLQCQLLANDIMRSQEAAIKALIVGQPEAALAALRGGTKTDLNG
jgi:hypothetical protein